MSRDLTALFAPRSVAVIGASDDDTKYGNWIAVRALRGNRKTSQERKCQAAAEVT